MERFTDTTVLMTGAASGIGRATALRFVAEGATVVALDRDEAGLARTCELAQGPGSIESAVVDLSQESEIVDAVRAAAATLGRLDVLVNVAGILKVPPLPTMRLEDYHAIFAVNAFAPMLMCREALPHLVDSSSVIVNVTSTAATKAHPGMTAYAASKGALLSFSYSLSAELAPRRIRVVPVSPGGVATPLTGNKETFAGFDTSWYARTYPLWGQPGEPEDLAGAIAFAASSDGAYLNGVELRVDGGSHT